MCGTSNLDLVLNGKVYRRGLKDVTVPSDLETIRRAFEASSINSGPTGPEEGGGAASGGAATRSPSPRRVFLIIDEADLLIQTLGRDRLPGASCYSTNPRRLKPVAPVPPPDARAEVSPEELVDDAFAELSDDQITAADCNDSLPARASESDVAGKAEEAMQLLHARRGELIHSSYHTVLVTATPSALLFLPRDGEYARRLQIAILPLRRAEPLPYFGFSRSLDPGRKIQHVPVPERAGALLPSSSAAEAAAPGLLSRYPGVLQMLEGIFDDPRCNLRVGLVHAVREIDGHASFQREIVGHANTRGASLLALTHDSGLGSGWSFTLLASERISSAISEEFGFPAALHADDISDDRLPWSVIRDRVKAKKSGAWSQLDDAGLVRFSSALQFSEVLDMVKKSHWENVIILSHLPSAYLACRLSYFAFVTLARS